MRYAVCVPNGGRNPGPTLLRSYRSGGDVLGGIRLGIVLRLSVLERVELGLKLRDSVGLLYDLLLAILRDPRGEILRAISLPALPSLGDNGVAVTPGDILAIYLDRSVVQDGNRRDLLGPRIAAGITRHNSLPVWWYGSGIATGKGQLVFRPNTLPHPLGIRALDADHQNVTRVVKRVGSVVLSFDGNYDLAEHFVLGRNRGF